MPRPGPTTVIDNRYLTTRTRIALQLPVAVFELRPFCTTDEQRAAINLRGSDILVLRAALSPDGDGYRGQHHIDAFLIASRGFVAVRPCRPCRALMEASPHNFASPFPFCTRMSLGFGGCCANCRWREGDA